MFFVMGIIFFRLEVTLNEIELYHKEYNKWFILVQEIKLYLF